MSIWGHTLSNFVLLPPALFVVAEKTEDYMNTLETEVYSPNVVNREHLDSSKW